MQPILIIGDDSANAPYHPISNVEALREIWAGHSLRFSTDYEDFTRLGGIPLCVSYMDAWKRSLSASQAESLRTYVQKGGKLLTLHNGISLQETPSLQEMLGARFTGHPPYCELDVKSLPGHPLAEGMEPFRIPDEPYRYEIYGDLRILGMYSHEGKEYPALWERVYGEGTLLHCSFGHDVPAFACEGYRALLQKILAYLLG